MFTHEMGEEDDGWVERRRRPVLQRRCFYARSYCCWCPGLPLRPDERERIEREEFEAQGFVSNIERQLVAVDQSQNGQFASRLAGLLSGSRRIPSTVLELVYDIPSGDSSGRSMKDQSVDTIVEDTAGAAEIEGTHTGGAPPADITTMLRHEPTEEVIAEEARKGYDLFLIGVEPAVAARGEIHENVARVAQAFEGPLAIAVARGPHREEPAAASHLNILVPVTGTEYSRRGAEVALTLARASLGSVTALHVARKGRAFGRRGGTPAFRPNWGVGADQEAILRDAVRLGDRFGVPVRTTIRAHAHAEEAILRQLKIGEHNLIVMGVSPTGGYALLRRRASNGVEAIPSLDLVGSELTDPAMSVAVASA